MAQTQTYTGTGLALVKVIHPLNTKDGDQVGPGAYTLKATATIQSTTALFGSALETSAGTRDRLLSDSAVSGADISDTAKFLCHFFWQTPTLGVENTFLNYTDSGETAHKFRFVRESSLGFFFRWHRATDFTPSNETIQVLGSESSVVLNQFHSIVGFLDANSITQGKIFVDAVDVTGVRSAINLTPSVAVTGFDHVLIGNHQAGFNVPARFMDHLTIIQGSTLTDTTVAALVAQYGGIGTDAVRGFGFRPTFQEFNISSGDFGDSRVLLGTGFGKDVTVTLGDVTVDNLVRVDDSRVEFDVPFGIPAASLVTLTITNVVSDVTLTVTEAFSVICDEEELRLILRGDKGGQAHPLFRLNLIDDDGTAIDVTDEVKSASIVHRRDDRRTDLALVAPPSSTLRVTFRNDEKQFTPGASGIFDGKLSFGRRLEPFIGYFVAGVKCFFPQGTFLLDDPSFNVAPSAEVAISARDIISMALERKISVRDLSTIDAENYVEEVLRKAGLLEGDMDLPFEVTFLPLTTTPAVVNVRALDIISEVMTRLQTAGTFRLIVEDGKAKIIQVPTSGLADQVFVWKREVESPYSRKERSNQASVRTTVTQGSPSISTTDASLATDSGTGATLPKAIAFSEAIRIEWRQGDSEALTLKETARTTTSLTIDRADTGLITDAWTISIRGDRTASVVGEAGPGIDQGGTGLGNILNALLLQRGRTTEVRVRFVEDDAAAQATADKVQTRFGAPIREITFRLINGNPLIKLNDLHRIVEKYSEDLSLYHVAEIRHDFRAQPVSLKTTVVGQFANIVEVDQTYDTAFKYNQGRIYDERVGVGNIEDEDLTFRGAVVTRAR